VALAASHDISGARGARSSQASVVKPHTVKCVSSALETGVSRTVESRSRALQSSVYNYIHTVLV
jgi:hypothetical protein